MIVFLDVDGTFADHGAVPAAHVMAVQQARAHGHRVLLCTGRPMPMLHPPILEAGFDGVVASAGAYVEVGGQVLRDERFPAGLARRTVDVLDAHDVAYVLESPKVLLGPPGTRARAERAYAPSSAAARDGIAPRSGLIFLDGLRTLPPTAANPSFSKVTVLESHITLADLGTRIGAGVATISGSIAGMGTASGEIFLAHVHKALGAQLVVEHLGADRADSIAVGDGLNDVEVLAWAGLGVAVEGAPAAVLEAAGRTTPGPERAGLASLFHELGLT